MTTRESHEFGRFFAFARWQHPSATYQPRNLAKSVADTVREGIRFVAASWISPHPDPADVDVSFTLSHIVKSLASLITGPSDFCPSYTTIRCVGVTSMSTRLRGSPPIWIMSPLYGLAIRCVGCWYSIASVARLTVARSSDLV